MTYQTQRSREASPGSIAKHRSGEPAQFTALAALSVYDITARFVEAMKDVGVVPTDAAKIAPDGLVHRFHCEGDKPGTRNGWCTLHPDGIPAGAFGNWRTGASGTWHAGHGRISPAQRARFREQVDAAKRERDAEVAARQADAQRRARQLWQQAAVPWPTHPYLLRKLVKAHGIRQLDKLLVIPMRDGDGQLRNVQTIDAEGRKRFLTDGRKRGLYFSIGPHVADELLIAEGYATAASLYETTGKPVAVAFDCGNLEPVARVLRAKFPEARIKVCADNDVKVQGNPGLTHATAAARAVGGSVAIPPDGCNDFNDAACARCAI